MRVQELFLPRVCPVCLTRALASRAERLCEACVAELPELGQPRCPQCGGTIDGVLAVCAECLRDGPRPWRLAVSVYSFRGRPRELIHRFKYRGHTYLVRWLAARMAENWRQCAADFRPEAVVPVPLHWWREIRRGYNQADLLAAHLGKHLQVPVQQALRRRHGTRQQAMLDFAQRQTNMQGVFEALPKASIAGKHVLVVDDVLTTGATLAAAAEALRAARVASVSVITAARG